MPKVVFVGAGPGDPELLTLKGKRYLETADCVVYAGSLINPAILSFAPPHALFIDSSKLSLEAIVECMAREAWAGKKVVRLHSGDPTLFGAIQEQIRALVQFGIEVEIVPGVSSVFAAAARLKREYTLPGVSQTLIITRLAGRTPVPGRERLRLLAQHRSSMAILLSARMCQEVQEELLTSFPPETPCAVLYHVTWPDEEIVEGVLSHLSQMVEERGIRQSAIILVGSFLKGEGQRSYLYSGERE
ncbi:precorrin-4 C(11)-methyltransferase [Candidatus Caldatribacterium sp.]|uniref:precorrin-4 C(11)-methyltransferase n=1 Tax=Candidatus Caldatribacterium sp. TaxID=2282143 RepID=UPI002996D8E0|nr:precorrin-4 C(11)-methyltransferase [Candidatus Caldatribacterium sp.]MDW8080290.1 precorrin-4 C(11)-methyltransferase [Candidatus Calescibacterium sp.]